jgi:hypothetical protein
MNKAYPFERRCDSGFRCDSEMLLQLAYYLLLVFRRQLTDSRFDEPVVDGK